MVRRVAVNETPGAVVSFTIMAKPTRSLRYCRECGKPLDLARTGRPKQFCSNACRAAYWRKQPRQTDIFDHLSQQGTS